MRRFTPALVLVLLLVAAFAVARADEPSSDPVEQLQAAMSELQAKVTALEGEVRYLRAREADLTTFALGHGAWSKDLAALLERVKAQGFLQRAIPVESRETLVQALTGFATSLGGGLPAVTKAQDQMLRQAAEGR